MCLLFLTLCLHFHVSIFPLFFCSPQTCSRILLQHSETLAFLDILHRPSLSALARKGLSKKINEKCRKVSRCPHCHAINGQYFQGVYIVFRFCDWDTKITEHVYMSHTCTSWLVVTATAEVMLLHGDHNSICHISEYMCMLPIDVIIYVPHNLWICAFYRIRCAL